MCSSYERHQSGVTRGQIKVFFPSSSSSSIQFYRRGEQVFFFFLNTQMHTCVLICVINTSRANARTRAHTPSVPHDCRLSARRDSYLTPRWQRLFNPRRGRFIAARLRRNASRRFFRSAECKSTANAATAAAPTATTKKKVLPRKITVGR